MVFENQGNVDLDSNIHNIRCEAISNFETQGFPTKKDEDWKYTSLKSVLNYDYSVFPNSETAVEFKDIKKYLLHEIDSYKVVFIDGVYSSFLSETTHDGYDICLMSAAFKKPKYKIVLDNYFNKLTFDITTPDMGTVTYNRLLGKPITLTDKKLEKIKIGLNQIELEMS